MINAIILDLDGVLINTPPWKSDRILADSYSEFDALAVRNFNSLLTSCEAQIWLSSTRRVNNTLTEFNTIFSNRGILQKIEGFLPIRFENQSRKKEIEDFLLKQSFQNVLILDDDSSLEDLSPPLKRFWLKTDSLIGLNHAKLEEAFRILKRWE